jgi:PiT family inorganic phosphate transporter
MISIVLLAALVAAFFVGWNIGSNDTANTMGTAVGGGVLRYRRAIMLMILFVILGAVLEGFHVMKTIGKDVVVPAENAPLTEAGEPVSPFQQLPLMAVVALIGAGLYVLIATTLGLPVSTSQSIVGGVIGVGLLLSYLQPQGVGAVIQFGKIGTIVICWMLTPLGAAFFAYVIHRFAGHLMGRVKNVLLVTKIFSALVIITCAYAAYALGANDVGNSTGVIYAAFGEGTGVGEMRTMQLIGLFGGVAMAVGALTYSRRVMRTVGTSITALDAMSAFAAQFGAALTVHLFTQFGIPVSTSQAIVGGVIGAGLVKGVLAVNKRKIGEIGIAWILTPLTAALFSFMLGLLAIGVFL